MPSIELEDHLAKGLDKVVPEWMRGERKTTMQVAMVVAEYIRSREALAVAEKLASGPAGDPQP